MHTESALSSVVWSSNIAGVLVGKTADVSTADRRKVMSANVDSVFLCSRAAMPHPVKSRGSRDWR
jgi:NAD(P)-dependent dehydrogenase (short-subunit alcohol dehydrogenase family)